MLSRSLTPVRAKRRLLREEGGNLREQKSENSSTPHAHVSVLTKEVAEFLSPQKGELVLDATAGAGGHSEALLQAADIKLIALDADPTAVEQVRKRLFVFGDHAQVIETNFRNVQKILSPHGVQKINKAVFDLGWNREQLAQGRGFSFQNDEPLNMSYALQPASGFTAKEIVNGWSEETLANVFFGYGEERYARRIAKKIIEARATTVIETTGDLVAILQSAVPTAYTHGKKHFATKTFQALRIAVNDELKSLETGLRDVWDLLAPEGRIAVISFHSIEDRLVKNLFKEFAAHGGILLTKKPLTASREELSINPSSRSAKLRVIQKK